MQYTKYNIIQALSAPKFTDITPKKQAEKSIDTKNGTDLRNEKSVAKIITPIKKRSE